MRKIFKSQVSRKTDAVSGDKDVIRTFGMSLQTKLTIKSIPVNKSLENEPCVIRETEGGIGVPHHCTKSTF